MPASYAELALAPPGRASRVLGILASCGAAPGWRAFAIAVLLSLPVPLAMATVPVIAINYTQHDVFIPLDAAWRTLQGQWPHSDFYSPLGLAYFWLHGAAAWLWGLDGRLVIRADLLALPIVLVPAILLAWRRLDALAAVLLVALLSVLVTAPTFLDGPERLVAHLASYNRIGGGLCALVCLWALARPRPHPGAAHLAAARLWNALEAVLLGLVLLVLLYLKITFFALALATLCVGCVTVRGAARAALPALAVVVLGALALEALHPGLLAAYLGDIRRAGAANTQLFRGYYTKDAIVANVVPGLLIAAMAGGVAWLAPEQRRGVLGIVVVAAGAVLVATQNFGAFSPPLVVLIMLLAQRLPAAAGPEAGAPDTRAPEARPVLQATGLFAVLAVALPFLITQAGGTAYHVGMTMKTTGVQLGAGRSDTLRDVVWFPNPLEKTFAPDSFTVEDARRWNVMLPVDVAGAILDDGLDLLRRDGLAGRRIANLAFSNPFGFALRAPSPHGGALWWDVDRTFVAARLTPAMVLGDAEVVMIPKLWWDYADVAALAGVVDATLRQDFTPHDSRYWTAWVRR